MRALIAFSLLFSAAQAANLHTGLNLPPGPDSGQWVQLDFTFVGTPHPAQIRFSAPEKVDSTIVVQNDRAWISSTATYLQIWFVDEVSLSAILTPFYPGPVTIEAGPTRIEGGQRQRSFTYNGVQHWRNAVVIPEPGAMGLAIVGFLAIRRRRVA